MALPTVTGIVLISWISDLLDGPLARTDTSSRPSWIGEHDAEADLAVSLGVAVFLVASSYIAAWVGLGLLTIIALIWGVHSHQLAWPLYALPYVILLWLTFAEAPTLAWVAAAYLAFALVFRWRRLTGEFMPEFFQAISSLRPPRPDGT
jgi:hypothetical protein